MLVEHFRLLREAEKMRLVEALNRDCEARRTTDKSLNVGPHEDCQQWEV